MNAAIAKNQHYEAKLKQENHIITNLETEIDRLRVLKRDLENEKCLNQSDYEMLTLEVEEFTKDIEKLQSTNMKFENLLRQKELRCEELEYKLSSYSQWETNKLETTYSTNFESKGKDTGRLRTYDGSPICTAINKLIVTVYGLIESQNDPEHVDREELQNETIVFEIFKGKSRFAVVTESVDLCDTIKKCDSIIEQQEEKIGRLQDAT